MKETVKRFLPLILILLVAAAFLIPKRMQEHAANRFGEPLFSHALPEDAKLIQKDAAKDDDGGTTAALLLQTNMDEAALLDFYSDMVYAPAEEGQTVILQVKALDESSIQALKQAKLYEDGAQYWFVYLYSK